MDGGPTPTPRQDRIRGMLYGVALGDALGAPHEFKNQVPLDRYTGRLEHPLTLFRRFQGGRLTGNVGAITDDTEMMIVLADALIDCGIAVEPVAGDDANDDGDTPIPIFQPRYNRHAVVERYIAWANSGCYFMGRNIRALFAGVSTVAGYEGRMRKMQAEPMVAWSQSNGCLMRCAPLTVLPNRGVAALIDCAITNPHPVCTDAVAAYTSAAELLIEGRDPETVSETAYRAAETNEVRRAIDEGRRRRPRAVSGDDKGWVAHGLYLAFYALHSPAVSLSDRLDEIVRRGGDTDTNAAIAGGLLGARHGARYMLHGDERAGRNLRCVLSCNAANGELPRPEQYGAARLPEIATRFAS